jgi:hypothetical protein
MSPVERKPLTTQYSNGRMTIAARRNIAEYSSTLEASLLRILLDSRPSIPRGFTFGVIGSPRVRRDSAFDIALEDEPLIEK